MGEGAYGVVVAGADRVTGRDVAVKFFNRKKLDSRAIQTEVAFLKCMRHRHVVGCIELINDSRHPCLVMEHFAGGDLVEGLQHRLKDRASVPCESYAHLGAQIMSAVEHLHSFSIVHRDVKSDNFMIDSKDILDPKLRLALGDFGVARALGPNERLKDPAGTKMFWAPEFFAMDYSLKVDVWAAGVVMYSLLVGRFPFRDEADARRREPLYPKRLSPDCREFLKAMLNKSEARRPSAAEVRNLAWLRGAADEGLDGEDTPSSTRSTSSCSSLAAAPAFDGPITTPTSFAKAKLGPRMPSDHEGGSSASTCAADRTPSVSTKQGSDGDTAGSGSESASGARLAAQPRAASVCSAAAAAQSVSTKAALRGPRWCFYFDPRASTSASSRRASLSKP